MANQRPLLTISLLISNRLDTIRRCLDSLRPLMEAVPSELILTDTSKNPKVNAICREYTEQVYEFEWCHDFAKARNFGLEKAKGEWFLFLDDDEWFVDVEELIEFFRSGEYQKYERATYLVRNFYDPAYVQYADCWVSRMNRIGADSQFVGKVHEYMEPCRGNEKHIHAMAYHSGYVFSTEEERSKHAERNIVLLLEALKDEPDNIRWQTQLAQEYRSSMNWEQLVSYCKERLEASMKGTSFSADEDRYTLGDMDAMTRIQFGTFFAGLPEGLIHTGKYRDSIVACGEILEDKQANPLLKAHAYICLAEAYFELDDWNKASEYADMYLKEEQRLNGTDILSYEQKMVSIVQHAFDPSNMKKAYSIQICRDFKQGSTKLLHKYYDRLEWNETVNFVFEKLPSYLVEVMPTLSYEPIFSQIITDTFKREDFRLFMCREALKWEDNLEIFSKLAYIYAQAESDFWFIWYMKIVDAANRGDKSLLEQIEKETWEEDVRAFIRQANEHQAEHARECLTSVFENCNWRVGYFENLVIERHVIDGPKDLGKLEQYHDVLIAYANMETVLESTVGAVEKIRAYIALEAEDGLEALKQLKQAVEICPDFAEGIGRFIGHYPDFEMQRVQKQRAEMKTLREQVLSQVKVLAGNGQKKEALAIIQQLKQMFPDDLEVMTLGLEIRL